MKQKGKMLSLLLIAGMLCGAVFSAPVTALAAESQPVASGLVTEKTVDGMSTVVSFEDGKKTALDGVVDLIVSERSSVMDKVESIEVFYKNEAVFTAEPRDIFASNGASELHGYYAVTFLFPDERQECFLTGLSAQKADTIKEELLAAYVEGEPFELESVDFIDAEKLGYLYGDSELCWAASCSDMLCYTGWGRLAGFDTEDDLFDLFSRHFDNKGYFDPDGIDWFFNGNHGSYYPDKTMILDYPDSGRYLPDYDSSMLWRVCDLKNDYIGGMKQLTADLRAGNAIGLSVQLSVTSAHAVTCWGYVTDNGYSDEDAAHYTALIICDSDDHIPTDTDDRRDAPNTLRFCPIREVDLSEPFYYSVPGVVHTAAGGALRDFTSLLPYSDTLPKETDPLATKNRTTTPDLKVLSASVSNADEITEDTSLLVGEGEVYVIPVITDYSDIDFIDYADIRVTVFQDGREAAQVTQNKFIKGASYFSVKQIIPVGELPAGEYTAEITVDPDKTLSEAYYMNNTLSIGFTVATPEFDLSEVTLKTAVRDDPADSVEYCELSYGNLPKELLQGADKAELAVSDYEYGSWSGYSAVRVREYSDAYPDLPAGVSFVKSDYEKAKLRLVLWYHGIRYTVYSDEMVFHTISVKNWETENNTPSFSPVPSGSTAFNEGEQLAFTLSNRSVNYPDTVSGAYAVGYYDTDSSEYIAASSYEPFTLALGEETEEIVIRSWDTPFESSKDLYLLIRLNVNGKETVVTTYLTELKVRESGGSTVTIDKDISDPCDGETSLREAIAYCKEHDEHRVSFEKDITDLSLESPLEIDSVITISADPKKPLHITAAENSAFFRITKDGSLSLTGMFLSSGSYTLSKDGVFSCAEGELSVSDCRFEHIRASGEGGVLFIDGGRARFKNCFFNEPAAKDGAVAYIDGGACVELLNCVSNFAQTSHSVFYNKNGELSIINSAVVNSIEADAQAFSAAPISQSAGERSSAVCCESEAQTNVINSIIMGNRLHRDIDGSVRLFSCAYHSAGEQVIKDSLSKVYESGEIFELSFLNNPVIHYDQNSVYGIPQLEQGAMEGSYVSEKDGVLRLTKDRQHFTDTGVRMSFTDDELRTDMTGNVRRAFYGPYARLASKVILGDADEDTKVSVLDATAVQKMLASITVMRFNKKAADVDRDGKVTVIDATHIQRYLASMPCPDGIGELIRILD